MKEVKKVALAGGLLWGAMMFVMTMLAVNYGYGGAFLDVMASIYPGYAVDFNGMFIGFVYGFLDVYVGVYLFVWVYNALPKKLK